VTAKWVSNRFVQDHKLAFRHHQLAIPPSQHADDFCATEHQRYKLSVSSRVLPK
jgi:hypothetical protein